MTNQPLRNAPHSLEAEQAVIGSMLIDARSVGEVMDKLTAEDFYVPTNAEIFAAISAMAAQAKPIDPVTVLDELKKRGTCDDKTATYVMQLMEMTPTAANVGHYTQIVREQAERRSLFHLAVSLCERAAQPETNAAQLLADATGSIQSLVDARIKSDLISSEQAAVNFMEYRDRLERGEGSVVLSTGYKSLDKILGGGLVQSGLYILAARPGIGKTTLGMQIADRVAAKHPVLFVTLEMDEEQLTARRVADTSGQKSTTLLLSEYLSETERAEMCTALSTISEKHLYMSRAKSATVPDIALMARKVQNLSLIVIDYLGLIQSSDNLRDSYERVTKISGDLKRLARSLGVPVLCLAQLNRAVEQRADKQPTIADLRDSGAIEQDADSVLLLHRPESNKRMEDRINTLKEPLTVIVAKNRHGSVGRVTMDFYPRNGRIRE